MDDVRIELTAEIYVMIRRIPSPVNDPGAAPIIRYRCSDGQTSTIEVAPAGALFRPRDVESIVSARFFATVEEAHAHLLWWHRQRLAEAATLGRDARNLKADRFMARLRAEV